MTYYEFEVVIPDAVFEHVTDNSIIDLLSSFNVKFECKGFHESAVEYLVTAPSFEVARAVRNLLFNLARVVLLSAYSFTDKQHVKGWIYGSIRQINY